MSLRNTRFLILSDTHANDWTPPDAPVDVAIHCGDLTEESKLHEFHHALRMLRNIKADLKPVIAGNHDWTLDTPKYEQKVAEGKTNAISEDAITKEWGTYGEARALIKEAAAADEGIVFLDEGKHQFDLKNGAHLNLFASPYTASPHAAGAFQYTPTAGHKFDIEEGIDVVITHSPPKGVLDRTDDRTNAGCPQLFKAVARARPRLHCFGHIHEAWGAKLVTWRASQAKEKPTALTAIDGGNSTVVESRTTLYPTKFDTEDSRAEKAKRLATYTNLNFCEITERPKAGEQTLFVNAAIEGPRHGVFQVPWVVDLELPATEAATAATAAASTTPNTTSSTQSASATHSTRPALRTMPSAPAHKRRRLSSDSCESPTDVPRKRQRRPAQPYRGKKHEAGPLLLLSPIFF